MTPQQADDLMRLVESGFDFVIALLIVLIFVGIAGLLFSNRGSNSNR